MKIPADNIFQVVDIVNIKMRASYRSGAHVPS